MHENQNELTQLDRRLVPSQPPGRLTKAAVLLMPAMGEQAVKPADFIGPRLDRPVALPDSPVKLIPERVGLPAHAVRAIHVPPDKGYSHWGLNE